MGTEEPCGRLGSQCGNIGESLSIDETMLHEDLFTILSNKVGHGRDGTIIAMVRGTRSEDVAEILMKIPEAERLKVKEVTMDSKV